MAIPSPRASARSFPLAPIDWKSNPEEWSRKIAEVANAASQGRIIATATGSSIGRSLADRLSEIVNVKDYDAKGDGATDDLTKFQNWIDSWSSGARFFFIPKPSGSNEYLIDGTILFENLHSAIIQGSGRNFSGAIKQTSGTTVPILDLGGQTAGATEPFDSVIRDLCLDMNDNNAPSGVLRFGKVNRFECHGLAIKDWDVGSAITNDDFGVSTLFQNMTFRECRLVGFDQANSIGYDFVISNGVYFDGGSVEKCLIGARLRSAYTRNSGLCTAHFSGVHFERMTVGIDTVDVSVIGTIEATDCPLKLGPGSVGCDIDLGRNNSGGESHFILDGNFGNKYRSLGAHNVSNNYEASPSVNFDGSEWLRVLNGNPDPVFKDHNLSDWTLSNATIVSKPVSLPGTNGGRAIAVTSSATSGYAERAVFVDDSEDWLLTACFVVSPNNDASARIQILDAPSTNIWDSGVLDFTSLGLDTNTSIFRFVRKRIPVPAGAGGTNELRIRLYADVSGEMTIWPLLLLSKSEFDMETDFTATATLSGSGVGAQLVFSEVVTEKFTIETTTEYENVAGAFAHIQTDVDNDNVGIGMFGDTNSEETGPLFDDDAFKAGDAMYLVSPVYPKNSRLFFRAFSGGSITVSEVTMHAIGRKNPWGLLSKHEDAALAATTTRVLGVAPAHCVLSRLSARLFVNTAITASGTNFWTVEIIRTRGATDTVMATVDSQAGWAIGDVLILAERNRTVEPGDIIKFRYTKTAAPANLEPSLSVHFGWDD